MKSGEHCSRGFKEDFKKYTILNMYIAKGQGQKDR